VLQLFHCKKLIINYLQKGKNNIIVFLFQNEKKVLKKTKKNLAKFGNVKDISVSLCAEIKKQYSS
jgi:uncharacterized protein YlbG (UPF0298 family)